MVGVVAASHSPDIAKGIRETACQMAPSVPFAAVGGTSDGDLGSEPYSILNAINAVDQGEGVIILFDLGSSGINSRMAVELLPNERQAKCHISNAALIEGAVIAAVESFIGKSLEEIENSLKDVIISKLD